MKFKSLLTKINEQSGSGPAQRAIRDVRVQSTTQREPSPNATGYKRLINQLSADAFSRLVRAFAGSQTNPKYGSIDKRA